MIVTDAIGKICADEMFLFGEQELNEESGMWFVTDFKDSHCHALAKPGEAFVLRSHRGLSEAQKAEAIELGINDLRTC